VGTLAGYSGIWIARGLSQGGRLITIESEPNHSDFALQQFKKAGVADRVELRRGMALDVLPTIARECGSGSVDLVFLDAVKTEYPDYWRLVRPLIAKGGVIIADNILGAGDWWIGSDGHPSREAADQFNRILARDPEFQVTGVPTTQGLLIGRRIA
jgi:caffeoyl-CoA O-methyltransferase